MSEDEQKDWPNCVFYPKDVKCPVRFEMTASSSVVKKIIEPLKKFDDRQVAMQMGKDMMEGLFKASGMEWSVLAAFCHICPYKFKKDTEHHQKALEEGVKALRVAQAQLKDRVNQGSHPHNEF